VAELNAVVPWLGLD